jgi:hypothetical protein
MEGRDTQTYRQHGDSISLFLFFQHMESRLKMLCTILSVSDFMAPSESILYRVNGRNINEQ